MSIIFTALLIASAITLVWALAILLLGAIVAFNVWRANTDNRTIMDPRRDDDLIASDGYPNFWPYL